MAKIKMTPEEKAAKRLSDRQLAALVRQMNFASKIEANKEATLAKMTDAQRIVFSSQLEKFNKRTSLTTDQLDLPENVMTPIEVSIIQQFKTWGNMSDSQINVVVQKADAAKKLKTAALFFEDYEVNEVYDHKLKLISHVEERNTSNNHFAASIVNVFRFENTAHQVFKLKTNNKKLIAAFSEMDKWYSFSSTVTYIAPGNKYICLKSIGLKLAK